MVKNGSEMFSRGTVKKIVSPGPATFTINLKRKIAQQWANLYPNNTKLCHRGAVRKPSGSCQGAVGEPSFAGLLAGWLAG